MATRLNPGNSYPIWPRPQELKLSGAGLKLDRPLAFATKGGADWLPAAAAQAAQVVNAAAGRRVVATRSGKGAALTVTTMDALPKAAGLARVNHKEGYALSVTPRGILLAGYDAAGVFYGAQTLADLLRREDGRALPGVKVRDWPTFARRGAHMYLPPREQMDFFFGVLDMMAHLKLNVLVLEVSGGMEYERHPEVNRAWKKFCKDALAYDYNKDKDSPGLRSPQHCDPRFPKTGPVGLQVSRYFRKDSTHTELAGGEWLTKDEIRRIISECAKRHIEIIPEVQSLSHSYYLCCAHPEIAEHQDNPFPDTYCPSNPKTYELLFDLMDEVIDVFRPRVMHIGHDEAYTFRVCPECRKRTGHEVFAGDVTKIHDFLAGRGIRTMLWGDKLMKLGRYGGVARWEKDPGTGKKWVQPPTWKSADMVPKDLIICDWYWSLDPHSERNFHKHGFEVFYGNFSPRGFKEWERRAGLPYVHGAEMSSWCEVSPEEFGHNATFYQFFPGADMLWRGRQMPWDDVAPLMARNMTPVVERLTGQERWLVSGGKGACRPVDISAAAVPLPKSLAGKVKVADQLGTLLGTGRFACVSAGGKLKKAVVLDKAAPHTEPIRVDGRAHKLLLLHGTTLEGVFRQPTYYSYHRGPADILHCRVTYADGKQATFSAYYGEDIGQMAGAWPTAAGWCYRSVPVAAGKAHTFFAQEWTNPRPDVAIRSIRISLGPDATDKGEVIVAAVSTLV